MNLALGPEVPPEYLGVWKRTLLRTPQREDTTTQVYWMQTQSWHADIRVPADRPALDGKTGLDQLNKTELMALANQQGFCGTTVVDGDICRWLRRHDYQPPSGANDIGRMEFDGPDRVFEYGVEAEYFEIWERLPGSRGMTSALQVDDDPLSLLLSAGEYVMSVRPRATKLPTANNLTAFLEGKNGQFLRESLDFEISFGRWISKEAWRIELSTLPWLQGMEGQSLPFG
jgi:hypothetical protein